MAVRGHSGLQRFATRFVDDATAAAMEAHSRAWLMRCPNCGFERSVWDMGGVRYGASGRSRSLMTCPQCGKSGWHAVMRAANFPQTKVSPWPMVRMIVGLMLAIWAVVAIVVLGILWAVGVI